LLGRGYRNSGVEENLNNSLIGNYYVASLINNEISRAIEIAFIPRNENANEAITVHVDNLNNDTFSLTGFRKSKNIRITGLNINSYTGSFPDRLENCLSKAHQVLMANLKEVIEGRTWEHVPIDWGEHK
jgi:hypothetical protein